MRMTRLIAFLALALPGGAVSAQDYAPGEAAEARIWLDRGDEPLLQRGDRVRIYYRASHDAYVAIFQVDTDGSVRLLHPRAPNDETFTRGGRDYRLLFPQSSYWFVDEYPGKGYFFMVASPEPFDLSAFDYAGHERSWDLTRVGRTVYEDPYLAMDDYIARLIPDWETVPYALDFIAYDVGEVHEYPRFLCYDCHGFRSYATWNPYTYACASFRVVVWDDPYFYPTYRYRGARVVYAGPRQGVGRYGFKERAAGETWTPLIQTRQPPLRRSADYVEPSAAQAPSREWVPPRRPTTPTDGNSGSPGATARPSGGAPSLGQPAQRRTSPSQGASPTPRGTSAGRGTPPATAQPRSTAPGRGTPSVRPTPSNGERPVLQRRPSGGGSARPSSGSTSRPSSRPSGGSTVRPSTRPSGGGATVRPPARPSGGSSARPSSGSRSSAGRSSPPARSTPPSRPARTVSPPRRSGSSSRPTVRAPARPTASARPSSGSRPPARKPAKPPPRRKPGGGGG